MYRLNLFHVCNTNSYVFSYLKFWFYKHPSIYSGAFVPDQIYPFVI